MSDPFADIQRELERADLQAVGVVMVRTRERATQVYWSLPGVTDPTLLTTTLDNATQEGQDLAGFIAIYETTARVFIRPQWRQRGWVTKYLDRLCRDLQKQGLAGFLRSLGMVAIELPSRS